MLDENASQINSDPPTPAPQRDDPDSEPNRLSLGAEVAQTFAAFARGIGPRERRQK